MQRFVLVIHAGCPEPFRNNDAQCVNVLGRAAGQQDGLALGVGTLARLGQRLQGLSFMTQTGSYPAACRLPSIRREMGGSSSTMCFRFSMKSSPNQYNTRECLA